MNVSNCNLLTIFTNFFGLLNSVIQTYILCKKRDPSRVIQKNSRNAIASDKMSLIEDVL